MTRHSDISPPLKSLIGREQELAAIARLLSASARLVTLTGPGGIGKTRLALAFAAQADDAFPDGIWCVSLASLSDADLVMASINIALGIEDQAHQDVGERLIAYLRERRALLVPDNFEHVLTAAPEITGLLVACPTLSVLVTSREPLRLTGEYEYPVPPLATPEANGPHGGEPSLDCDAVRLFVERARQVSPGFMLDDRTVPVVNEICRRLDGLPLALELAAARIKLFAPDDLLARLDQPLAMLTGGPRDAPARQQTMRATLDWSYRLLTVNEQQLFRMLAVFVGGWTLAAVEAIAADDRVIETLSSLVDKGLVRRVGSSGWTTRYDMLEPIRQFAWDLLAGDEDEASRARQRHTDYFAALVQGLNTRLEGPDGPAWFARIEAEHGNLRAILRCVQECEQTELGLQLIADLGIFWTQRAFISESRAYAETFLHMPGATDRTIARARALWPASWLSVYGGDCETALSMAAEARSIAQEQDDRYTFAHATFAGAAHRTELGEMERATAEFEQALSIFRALGDAPMVGRTLVFLGNLARHQGDLARSHALLDEALAIARAGGLRWIAAIALSHLGRLAEQSGDDLAALALYREWLSHSHELGIAGGIAESIEHIARIARRRRDMGDAVCLLAAASALRERSDSAWIDATGLSNPDQELTALRDAMPESDFRAAWKHGRGMSMDEAVDFTSQYAVNVGAGLDSPPLAGLTRRETEVLALLTRGLSNREIAAQLFISTRTVERHIENLYRKLDVHSRAEAVAFGQREMTD